MAACLILPRNVDIYQTYVRECIIRFLFAFVSERTKPVHDFVNIGHVTIASHDAEVHAEAARIVAVVLDGGFVDTRSTIMTNSIPDVVGDLHAV